MTTGRKAKIALNPAGLRESQPAGMVGRGQEERNALDHVHTPTAKGANSSCVITKHDSYSLVSEGTSMLYTKRRLKLRRLMTK